MIDVIFNIYPDSPVADAYRGIRANIRFSDPGSEIKTIVVTSAGPSEGKTTTAVNMAASMAGLGKKVLVMDCDLRKPEIHSHFNVPNEHGILDALFDGGDELEVISTKEGFDIILSGKKRERAVEMLDSSEMRSIMQKLRSSYDYVFIDTPSLGEAPDAAVLSAMADGAILVCASEKVSVEKVRQAKFFLEQVNAHIIGVVVNNASDERAYDYGMTIVDRIRSFFSVLSI